MKARIFAFLLCMTMNLGVAHATTPTPDEAEEVDTSPEDSIELRYPSPTFTKLSTLPPRQNTMPSGALIAPLEINNPAPFPGVLWNEEASAWLIAEFSSTQEILIAESERRLAIMKAWAYFSLESANISHKATIKFYEIRLRSQEDTIDNLFETNEKLQKNVGFTRREKFITSLWAIGIGLVGGLAGYWSGKSK